MYKYALSPIGLQYKAIVALFNRTFIWEMRPTPAKASLNSTNYPSPEEESSPPGQMRRAWTRGPCQARSKIVAGAMAPPVQSVTRAYFPLRRASSCTAVTDSRQPELPTG